jgi:hypothetical protein
LKLNVSNGEPKDAPFLAPYMTSLRQSIEQNWRAFGGNCDSESIVFFMVAPNGELRNIALNHASGNSGFDEALIDSVLRTSPFLSPPKFGKEVLFVYATFNGRLVSKRTNLKPSQPPVPDFQQARPLLEGTSVNIDSRAYLNSDSRSNAASTRPDVNGPESFAENKSMSHGHERTDSQFDEGSVTPTSQSTPSARAIPLSASVDDFRLIPTSKLQYCTEDQIIQYLTCLHEWLKLPLEELLK